MANEEWEGLARVSRTWEWVCDGLDVSFHNDEGKIDETPYREKTTFHTFGAVDNADERLNGLGCFTAAYREVEGSPVRTEVGYWRWDATNKLVASRFAYPLAQSLIAGARVEPDATYLKLESVIGSNTFGILSNLHLDQIAPTCEGRRDRSISGAGMRMKATTLLGRSRSRGSSCAHRRW